MSRRVPLLALGISLCALLAVWLWDISGSRSPRPGEYVSHPHIGTLGPEATQAIRETVWDWMSNYEMNRRTVKARGYREPTKLPPSIRSWRMEEKGEYVYSLHVGRTFVNVTVQVQNPDGSTTDEALQLSLAPAGREGFTSWRIESVYMPSRP